MSTGRTQDPADMQQIAIKIAEQACSAPRP